MTFEEFAAARVSALLRTAGALSGDPGLAEDLVQNVLIKVHRRWDHLASLEARDRYVHRMLVNEFLSWRRKWGRVVPLADLELRDEVSDHALTHADRQLLSKQVNALPRRQQVVLVLRYYSGLDDVEIADVLGCRAGTVRSLASRGLSRLRVDPVLRAEFALTPIEEGHTR
jgi:RNA polymerase sigma-70 factor (sigma-E family)